MKRVTKRAGKTAVLGADVVPAAAWNRALWEAAARGDWHGIERAIAGGADVNTSDENGVTVLMLAVRRHTNLDIVRHLVECGADVSARDHAGKGVLDHISFPEEPPEAWENAHEAWAHSEDVFVEEYLLGLGAPRSVPAPVTPQPSADSAPADLPLGFAVKRPVPNLGRRASGLDWPLFAAIQRGATGDIEALLATDKVNVNARDDSGWTPLMRAAAANDLEVVRLLLASGADAAAADRKGLTALDVAGSEARAALRECLA